MTREKVCDCSCHRNKFEMHFEACCNGPQLGSILVTGAAGMIGQQLVPLLREYGFQIFTPSKTEMNCMVFENVRDYFSQHKPDYCIFLHGYNGGISFNAAVPADIYMQNAFMALNTLAVSSAYCQKVLSVLPSCAYSAFDELGEPRSMLFEKDFEAGLPHGSVETHGLAKRIAFDYSRQLYKQFKFNAVCCVLNNLFGPGERFKEPDRLKVCGSLIQRFLLAKRNGETSVLIWGSGEVLRELMYVKDAANGIFHIFQRYDNYEEVINIGPGIETSIKNLAYLIRDLVGYEGRVEFDMNRPDGQKRKLLAPYKMEELGWKPQYSLEDGIKETVKYLEERLDM